MKPAEWNKTLKHMGMQWRSHHVLGTPFKMPAGAKPPTDANGNSIKIPPMLNLKDNFQELVDMAAEGGVEYLVCANISLGTAAEIKEAVDILNKANEAAQQAKLKLVYHNHDWEFKAVDGVIPYDVLLQETAIRMELDLAWAIKGGKDPVAMFQQHPGRFPLWHVKDLDESRNNVLPVGKGTIDFRRIFQASSASGLKYYFVEHDMPKDALASIKDSMQYLKSL
jgi:sugar phosphate isomerase/epimerase